MGSSASRGRLVDAMGLGPMWVRRTSSRVDDAHEIGDGRTMRILDLDWDPLRDDVARCVACDRSRSRTQTVFGVGARRPDWLIIGDGPGEEEDAHGEPFVGQAGRLLDAMLASVGLSRARNAFVAQVVKCRATADRDPTADEAACCRPYLDRQIALLAPRMILAVGRVATRALLGADQPIGALRGRRHSVTIDAREIPLVATDHPAELLRSGEGKADAWADLCFAREVFRQLDATTVS